MKNVIGIKRIFAFMLTIIGMSQICVFSQELDATVTINAMQIEASYRDRLNTMQQDLQEFINGYQWTQKQFSPVEKIKCSFAFNISDMPSTDNYEASLTIQSRRPVYYSNYNTSTFNWKDDNISFAYTEGQTFTFNEFNLEDDLIAIIAYYAYMIIGTDFDSFSPYGGEAYFKTADGIVSQMQASSNSGWKAFANKKNRHALITALLDENQKQYREIWYTYHRLGLDQMYQSVDKGRAQVTAALKELASVRKADPQTPLLNLFISSKLDEIINIYSKASQDEKKSIYAQLNEVYPTYSNKLQEITKTSK